MSKYTFKSIKAIITISWTLDEFPIIYMNAMTYSGLQYRVTCYLSISILRSWSHQAEIE